MVDNRNNCPECENDSNSIFNSFNDDGVYIEIMECHDCSYQWENVYELTARFTKTDASGNSNRLDTYKTVSDKEWAHDKVNYFFGPE